MLTLASFWVGLWSFLFILVCAFLILVILIQKPRGGGLSGAFGGGGGSAQAVFGAKVGDALTKFTVACFVIYLLLAMALTWTIRPNQAAPPEPEAVPADSGTPASGSQEGEAAANPPEGAGTAAAVNGEGTASAGTEPATAPADQAPIAPAPTSPAPNDTETKP